MSPEAKAAKRAKFALECRKVRLFIAEHPGTTDYEIKQATKISPDFHLRKMVGMGIVELNQQYDPDTHGQSRKWYVVPQ